MFTRAVGPGWYEAGPLALGCRRCLLREWGARRRLSAEGIQFFDEGAKLLGVGDVDFDFMAQLVVEITEGIEIDGAG